MHIVFLNSMQDHRKKTCFRLDSRNDELCLMSTGLTVVYSIVSDFPSNNSFFDLIIDNGFQLLDKAYAA